MDMATGIMCHAISMWRIIIINCTLSSLWSTLRDARSEVPTEMAFLCDTEVNVWCMHGLTLVLMELETVYNSRLVQRNSKTRSCMNSFNCIILGATPCLMTRAVDGHRMSGWKKKFCRYHKSALVDRIAQIFSEICVRSSMHPNKTIYVCTRQISQLLCCYNGECTRVLICVFSVILFSELGRAMRRVNSE